MMVNKQKRKGHAWEKELAENLEESLGGTWKVIPGSGALGTTLDEPLLTSDIQGKLEYFPYKFQIEAKTGYGGAKQFTLKKEWLDKVAEEASLTNSIPILGGKFLNGRGRTKSFIVMDFATFVQIMTIIEDMYVELEKFYDKRNIN